MPHARSVYVAASEAESGKTLVALGVLELLARRSPRIGIFRPVVADTTHPDAVLELLTAQGPHRPATGVDYDAVQADPDAALETILERFAPLEEECDSVLVVGTDFTGVGAPVELAFNARVAVTLGVPVLPVVKGAGRDAREVAAAVDVALATLRASSCQVLGVVANRVPPAEARAIEAALADEEVPAFVVPEDPLLGAPTVGALLKAVDARSLTGDPELLEREALGLIVAAMTVPNLLEHLDEGTFVVTPGDRADVLLTVLTAHASTTFPFLSGIVLTGGLEPPAPVRHLLEGLNSPLPVALTAADTYDTARALSGVRGRIRPQAGRRVETALALFEGHVDEHLLLERLDFAGAAGGVVTPLQFERELVERARAHRRRIVLPEGTEERVLRAAEILLDRDVADLTLLGPPDVVRQAAERLRLDVSGARVVDPEAPALREHLAAEYAARRAHKGVTLDGARDIVVDPSYAGTLMVALGMADGMVSGAAHTTAQTIRPSFELIRARPGVSLVSSVLFMCLPDRVLVYGDCAINPNPTSEQLADIALSSAETAAAFGVPPRIAMLSYATGESGRGEDVDRVSEATALVRARRPDLLVEGPIQYDAAVDLSVAATKLPRSEVAGRATVFVFPDLNTGNTTYKAVQRSAGAVAIGPVLQGLNRPVNDLSRGATVRDIVNTVAITAIQAWEQERAQPLAA
jgi:phosphate acetyltransferase